MRIASELAPVTPQTDSQTGLKPLEVEKLRKSARDFESLLLNSLWKEMQAESESEEDAGPGGGFGGPLQELAFQAVANQAAASGGLGLGRLILRSLGVSDSPTPKVTLGLQNYGVSADGIDMHRSSLSPETQGSIPDRINEIH